MNAVTQFSKLTKRKLTNMLNWERNHVEFKSTNKIPNFNPIWRIVQRRTRQ